MGLLKTVEATTALVGVFGDTESDLLGLTSLARVVFSRMRAGAGPPGGISTVSGLGCGTNGSCGNLWTGQQPAWASLKPRLWAPRS